MSADQAVKEFEVLGALAGGPLTLDGLWLRLGVFDDPRWAAGAFYRLLGAGRVRFVGCDHGDNHDGSCVVELTAGDR